MPANLSVTYAEMQNTARQFNQLAQERQNLSEKIRNLSNTLVQSGFRTDRASVAFNNMVNQWAQIQQRDTQEVAQMSAFLNQAVVELQNTDANIAGRAHLA